MAKQKKTSHTKHAKADRPLWTPYYPRVTRNRKKYTRKQKHKPDYQTRFFE